MNINFKKYQSELENTIIDGLDLKEMYGKCVLITGASGLIGSTIIDILIHLNRLNNANIRIYGLSRSLEKLEKRFDYRLKSDNLFLVAADVNNLQFIDEKFEYIIHAASNADPYTYAMFPVETITTNIFGTTHLLNYLRKNNNCKMVFTSTIEVYGTNEEFITYSEETYGKINFNNIRSGYPESKRVSELLCKSYVQQYSVNCNIVRLGYIYGPTMSLDDSKVVAQFLRNAISRRDIVLKSKGEQVRSYCYVLDAVTGILVALIRGKNGEAYNIADNNSRISIRELAELVSTIVGTKVTYELPSEIELKGFSEPQDAVLNTNKLERLGWKSRTNISTGLSKTIDMFDFNEI